MPPTQAAAQPEIDSVSDGMKVLESQDRSLVIGVWAVTVLLAAIAFWFAFVYFGTSSTDSSDLENRLLVVALPLMIPLMFYGYLSSKARHEMVAQIAQSFGYTYQKTASMSDVSGAIFTQGHSRNITDVMAGMYRDLPIRFYTYSYTVQEGKHSHTYHDVVCELTYSSPLPHMVLLAQNFFGNGDVGFFSGLGSLQKAQLEGGFDEHFKLYVDPGAQIELREVLQPDVMQDLIDRFHDDDLEIHGNKIYLLQHGLLMTRDRYVTLRTLADSLIDKLLPGLRSAAEGASAPAN